MKKVLSVVLSSLTALGTYAQLDPGTDPQNKNVLLEDLTGIHCGYCPDGAKKADAFRASNPGRVVIIGNHCSGYSTPGAYPDDKDFRTNEGNAVDKFSIKHTAPSNGGYPAGNINRRMHSQTYDPGFTGTSRTYWAGVGATVMSEPSPVNLAAEAYYYPGSTEIHVNVAGYYTADGDGSDYLSVAILQDNLDSYQSGASGYTARIQSSGLYRQMDVLRKYLTPMSVAEMGEEIGVTTETTRFDRSYTYDASEPIVHSWTGTTVTVSDVPANVEDMHVVVFVTEDLAFSEVITAIDVDIEERPTGISEVKSMEDVKVYPNPFSTNAIIEFNLDKSTALNIAMYDVQGRMVQQLANTTYGAGNQRITLDGTNLNAGVYTVRFVAEDGVMTRKVVLNK